LKGLGAELRYHDPHVPALRDAFFGVVIPDARMRQIEGARPDAVRRDLADVCTSFNGSVERLGRFAV
jgi:hypothetical protein